LAASSGIARPIYPYRVKNNATGVAEIQRIGEKSGQTFLQGTPVQIDVAGATGFIIANPAIVSVATAIIAGFSHEFGHNLAVSGVFVAQTTGQGVPNQPSAVVNPIGAVAIDNIIGGIGFYVANDIVNFIGTYGDSVTAANAVLAQAQVGAIRGLTKDAGNNFWYIDNAITTTAGGACVEIVSLVDPIGTLNGRVEFRVTHAAQQLAT